MRAVAALNVLIVLAMVSSVGAVAATATTVAGAAPSVTVGQAATSAAGSSVTVSIPVKITNPGPLALTGIGASILVSDSTGATLVQGSANPSAIPPGSSQALPISVSLDARSIPASALQRLATTDENLSLSINVTGSVSPFVSATVSLTDRLPWGAPVKNLQIGAVSLQPVNATYSRIGAPVTFFNGNNYFGISGTVSGQILVTSSGVVAGTLPSASFTANPDSQFSAQFSGFVQNQYAGAKGFTLVLTFSTQWGTVVKQVDVSA